MKTTTTSIHQIPVSTNDGWVVTGKLNGEPFTETFQFLSEAMDYVGQFINDHK